MKEVDRRENNNDDDDDVYKKTPIFRTWHYSMALSFLGQRDQIRRRMQQPTGALPSQRSSCTPTLTQQIHILQRVLTMAGGHGHFGE